VFEGEAPRGIWSSFGFSPDAKAIRDSDPRRARGRGEGASKETVFVEKCLPPLYMEFL
jgi:hypothetical protein